jgi:uncharacterized protein (TIGR02145 family)
MRNPAVRSLPVLVVIGLIAFLVWRARRPAPPSTFRDPRDGHVYRIVGTGFQVWMAENLDYRFGNSWCYENRPENCETYGRLYDWWTARHACPEGWHLPMDEEWDLLAQAAGDSDEAGAQLKSRDGWDHDSSFDALGFHALPSGNRSEEGTFQLAGHLADFWSASQDGERYGRSLSLVTSDDVVYRHHDFKAFGFAVRCIRN